MKEHNQVKQQNQLKRHSLVISAFLAIGSGLIILVLLASSTYAWFTLRTYTNVTPLSGTISGGDGDLLISNQRDGSYDVTCELLLRNSSAELLPITTADLVNFYTINAQNEDGIATAYREANDMATENTLSGTLYLKAQGNPMDVYLWRDSISCGTDAQALASMRLGLRITTSSGTVTHIFRLDDLASTSGVETRQTVSTSGTVVASIGSNGTPNYVTDPSVQISEAFASGNVDAVIPGSRSLCSLEKEEIAEVQYWLYIEGCDDQCVNRLQGRDIALQFGFAGV